MRIGRSHTEKPMQEHQNESAPSVGKKASDPLMARASMEPMITMKTASNAVFSASERLLPILTIIRVNVNNYPAYETCRKVNSLGSVPIPSNV